MRRLTSHTQYSRNTEFSLADWVLSRPEVIVIRKRIQLRRPPQPPISDVESGAPFPAIRQTKFFSFRYRHVYLSLHFSS